jgi:EAL domain-containing protein (putative c-di-GMP-specific phosphodiesterase class I)
MHLVKPPACAACKDGVEQPFPFSMAFQPIVDVDAGTAFAYEALVRGPKGEPAGTVLSQVTEANVYAFDQSCRVTAITLAARLGLPQTGAHLSINFMPGAVYSPVACIQLTLATAVRVSFPCEQLIFEIVESEKVRSSAHLRGIVAEYQRHGFRVALDDFGSGYSGVNLLADFPADLIKLDMELIRDIHTRPRAMTIVRSVAGLARALGSVVIAEGVETAEEYAALRDCGISLMQGYLFARPRFEALGGFTLPGPSLPRSIAGAELRVLA